MVDQMVLKVKQKARELYRGMAGTFDKWKSFEEQVEESVRLRVWEVLGHPSFVVGWEKENGFKCPTEAKVRAILVFVGENGVNVQRGSRRSTDDPTMKQIADFIGCSRGTVVGVLRQVKYGVPAEHIRSVTGNGSIPIITRYGTKPIPEKDIEAIRSRTKKKNVKAGKQMDELVFDNISLPKWASVAATEVARANDVNRTDVYRRYVIEGLRRQKHVWSDLVDEGVE